MKCRSAIAWWLTFLDHPICCMLWQFCAPCGVFTELILFSSVTEVRAESYLAGFKKVITKYQIKYPCAWMIAVSNAIFHSPISCFIAEIFAIMLQSCPKFVQPKFWCFGAANFWGEGPQISDSILWTRVTIERVKIWWQLTEQLRD